MLKRYILILLTTILIVIFAVQNVEKVHIKLWVFDLHASLSLIIILTFAVGAIITILFTFWEIRSRNAQIKKLEKRLQEQPEKDSFGSSLEGDSMDFET
ncbi:MAG: LapA family protein [Bacteroidales bacterium]|nr:LapA family protein [Bacteroidales bacterium]